MEDFYFAYGYNSKKRTASRLYRYISGNFERFDPEEKTWKSAPEQCKIFAGGDWEYDEITEQEAMELSVSV